MTAAAVEHVLPQCHLDYSMNSLILCNERSDNHCGRAYVASISLCTVHLSDRLVLLQKSVKMSKLALSLSTKPATLYNYNALEPPGINNTANNCYGSSVIQCLLNHSAFLSLIEEIAEDHKTNVCNSCQASGTYIIH